MPALAKFGAAAVLVCVLGLGGYIGARGLSSAAAGLSEEDLGVMTVQEVVTIRGPARVVTERGRVVVKPLRVPGKGSTAYSTEVVRGTVTAAGGERIVTLREVAANAARDIVTVNGQPRTVVETRAGPARVSVVTDRQTVTAERLVTNERVVTNDRVLTNERVLTTERVVTVNGQPVTVNRVVTQTLPVTIRSTDTVRVTTTVRTTTTVPTTVTQRETQTQTQTRTETVTRTDTVPVTVTVTRTDTVPVTVTVTVEEPRPPKPPKP